MPKGMKNYVDRLEKEAGTLRAEVAKLKLERRGFQVMARHMVAHGAGAYAIVCGAYERAGGNAVCPTCRLELMEHPQVNDYPTFHVLCDGSIVKT